MVAVSDQFCRIDCVSSVCLCILCLISDEVGRERSHLLYVTMSFFLLLVITVEDVLCLRPERKFAQLTGNFDTPFASVA